MESSDLNGRVRENRIIFICWLAYTAAYVGRLNYNASMVAIIPDLGTTKARAGLVSSMFFFAYGIGQLVNGVLSKRYNAKKMVFFSLSVSAVLNLIMPLCGNISSMKYVWLVNGAIQSILWSTLIKTLADFVSDEKLPRAVLYMSATVTVGTFIAYGVSALAVRSGDWRATFYFASAVLFVSAFVWLFLYGPNPESPVFKKERVERTKIKPDGTVVAALGVASLAGIADGFIKDGVNAWTPSVLYEEFGVSPSFSILLTLFLPVVSTLSAAAAKNVHKKIESHSTMDLMFFTFSALMCAGVLLSLRARGLIFIMVCFTGVASGMSMINNVVTSMLPLDFRRFVDAGLAAGVLNAFCYAGGTLASFLLGAISQSRGWNVVFNVVFAVCLAAVVLSFAGLAVEKRTKKYSPR